MKQPIEYSKLINHAKRISTLSSCANLLAWDQQTYMPKNGGKHRAEQLSLLAGMIHELSVSPEIQDWLYVCEGCPSLMEDDSESFANIRELIRGYDKSVKLPKRLVEELTKARSDAYSSWEEARNTSNYKILLPYLDVVVKLVREYADTVGYRESIYDALLDNYEPGLLTSDIEILFDNLKAELVPLLNKITTDVNPSYESHAANFKPEYQYLFAKIVTSKIGFDLNSGRIDGITAHHFSIGIGPGDSRVTTR